MLGFSRVQQILIKQYYTFYINILRLKKKVKSLETKEFSHFSTAITSFITHYHSSQLKLCQNICQSQNNKLLAVYNI